MKIAPLTPEEEVMFEPGKFYTKEEVQEIKDMVNRPPHYTQGDIECIDAMVAARGKEAVAIYCELAAFKYLWREGRKDDPVQELGKIAWYVNKAKELRSE